LWVLLANDLSNESLCSDNIEGSDTEETLGIEDSLGLEDLSGIGTVELTGFEMMRI